MAVKKVKVNKGVSVIEILVVVAILGVALVSISDLVNLSLKSSQLSKQTVLANSLSQEAMEAVRSFRDETSWLDNGLGSLTIGTAYHPEKTVGSPPDWNLVLGEETIDIFTRKIVFETVYRDGSANIADSGVEDPETKKVRVTVLWQERGKSHQTELITYFTNWQQQ